MEKKFIKVIIKMSKYFCDTDRVHLNRDSVEQCFLHETYDENSFTQIPPNGVAEPKYANMGAEYSCTKTEGFVQVRLGETHDMTHTPAYKCVLSTGGGAPPAPPTPPTPPAPPTLPTLPTLPTPASSSATTNSGSDASPSGSSATADAASTSVNPPPASSGSAAADATNTSAGATDDATSTSASSSSSVPPSSASSSAATAATTTPTMAGCIDQYSACRANVNQNGMASAPKTCQTRQGDHQNDKVRTVHGAAVKALNLRDACTLSNQCYFRGDLDGKPEVFMYPLTGTPYHSAHAPDICEAAPVCPSSSIVTEDSSRNRTLPKCYVRGANDEKLFFSSVAGASVINNSQIKCDLDNVSFRTGMTQAQAELHDNLFDESDYAVCSLQNLQLRGACEDETCSQYNLNS